MRLKPWIQPVLGTVVAVNLMLLAFIIGQHFVHIPTESPVILPIKPNSLARTEYVMELVSTKTVPEANVNDSPTRQAGSWSVEHYAEYAYYFDAYGQLIKKEPTGKTENLRYWNGGDHQTFYSSDEPDDE